MDAKSAREELDREELDQEELDDQDKTLDYIDDEDPEAEETDYASGRGKIISKYGFIPDYEDRKEPGFEPLLTVDEKAHPVTLKLTKFIEHAGQTITELTMQPPDGDDVMRDGEEAESRKPRKSNTKFTLAKACNVPLPVIGKAHARDLGRLSNIFWAFTSE